MIDIAAPRRQQPLSAQVADQLKEQIASGALPVGSKIPSEHQLAETLGISRNSVREALRSLVHAGLLASRAGDGTYVTAQTELEVALQRRAATEPADDVFEVRGILERAAVELAARRATPEVVDGLRRLLADRDAAVGFRAFAERDLAFHQGIVDASGNALLAEIYRNLDGLSQQLDHLSGSGRRYREFRRVNAALNELHDELVSALSARDPERAAGLAGRIVGEARALHARTIGGAS